jgi:hypothetical protein
LFGTIRPFLPEMRDLSESEHPFSGYPFVRQHDAMLIEPSIYLNAMLTDFRIAGGTVRLVHFEHASQLQLARDATGFLSALVWRGDFHPPSFRC